MLSTGFSSPQEISYLRVSSNLKTSGPASRHWTPRPLAREYWDLRHAWEAVAKPIQSNRDVRDAGTRKPTSTWEDDWDGGWETKWHPSIARLHSPFALVRWVQWSSYVNRPDQVYCTSSTTPHPVNSDLVGEITNSPRPCGLPTVTENAGHL
jgi:hypothetical protein